MRDHEYQNIPYFRKMKAYKPSDRFLKYRLNLLIASSAFAFFSLAEFETKKINLLLISGSLENTYVIELFFLIFLIYFLIMFSVLSKFEVENFRLRYSFHGFLMDIAKYQFNQLLNPHRRHSSPDTNEIPIDIFSSAGSTKPNEITLWLHEKQAFNFGINISDLKAHSEIKYEKKQLTYHYESTDKDKKKFKELTPFRRNATSLNFLDVYLPYFAAFGSFFIYLYKKDLHVISHLF